jgi:methionine-rich copper-binding protein CopC
VVLASALAHSSKDGTMPEDGASLEATSLAAPDLGPGLYTVDWRAMSADGHAVNGSFSFTVTGN